MDDKALNKRLRSKVAMHMLFGLGGAVVIIGALFKILHLEIGPITGGLVLGICNGFQILTETGLLKGVLQQNKNIEFICKNIFVKINNSENKFFENIDKDILELHIAHNEGNYF